MTQSRHHIAHLNVARLRGQPGVARVAQLVNAVPAVNAMAERCPGLVWRRKDNATRRAPDAPCQAALPDPLRAMPLSVWERATVLMAFVAQTLRGAFVRRRADWFEPSAGPACVIGPVAVENVPTIAHGQVRMAHLARNGPTHYAFDFATHTTFAA